MSDNHPREVQALPPNWSIAKLGEVVTIIRGVTYRKQDALTHPAPEFFPILRATNISETLDFDSLVFVPGHYINAEQFLVPGDIIVAASSGSRKVVGKAAQLDRPWYGSFGAFCFALRPKQGIDPKYIGFFLQTQEYRQRVARLAAGININNLKVEHIAETLLPVAPFSEQRRIVAETDSHLTRLNAAADTLRRLQTKLKGYRASVLNAAVEGRLVPREAELARAEGREYEPAEVFLRSIVEAKQVSDKSNNQHGHPKLPKGWMWSRLSQLTWDAGYGTSQKCEYEAAGRPVVRIPNVVKGRIETSDLKNAISLDGFAIDAALKPGDFLVIRTNGSKDLIGRGALVRSDFPQPTYFASYLIRLRIVSTGGFSEWISAIWDSPFIRAQLERLAATSAGQYNVSLGSLYALQIPVPPEPEIQRIVDEIGRRFSVLAQVESTVSVSLQRAESLRVSILNRAFEGSLVPQIPSEEPATSLLEQIRKSRESDAAVRPRRGRGVKREVPSNSPAGVEAFEAGKPKVAQVVAVSEPAQEDKNFLDLPREEQIDHVWESLLGQGPLDKDAAIRTAALILRDRGLARFQRLREDGPLYAAIAAALDRGVREGSFDRPKRGLVRARLPDAKAYTSKEWTLCLLQSLDGQPVPQEDALRKAAEWARETLGLTFARLREDGVILSGLKAALDEAVKAGWVIRQRGKVSRPTDSSPEGATSVEPGA
ncbi:MAG: restriction endonuclease subunit S [Thermoanaerobaculia bacterium]